MAELHQPHSKFVIGTVKERKEFAKAIFELTIEPGALAELDLESLEIEDASFVDDDFKEHHSDILFSVKNQAGKQGKNVYLLFEHKSHPDPNILGQLLRYICEIHARQEEKVPILAVVFYHGEKKWELARSFHELYGLSETQVEAFGGHVLNFRYGLLDAGRLEIHQLRTTLAFRAFLKILSGIWFFEEPGVIREFLIAYRQLFFENSEEPFLRKMMFYIYGVRNIKSPSQNLF